MLETGNGAHTRGAKYKMTRTKNKLVEHYGALDIISTEDEEREGWDYIDIVYAGTDYGIQYYHTPREAYQKALEVCEAYCMGYNQALDDIKEGK